MPRCVHTGGADRRTPVLYELGQWHAKGLGDRVHGAERRVPSFGLEARDVVRGETGLLGESLEAQAASLPEPPHICAERHGPVMPDEADVNHNSWL